MSTDLQSESQTYEDQTAAQDAPSTGRWWKPGLLVLGMVLDTLSGRSPLYHLETEFETADRELLFGEALPTEYFSDDNLGRVLDAIYRAGTQKGFSALAATAVEVMAQIVREPVPDPRPLALNEVRAAFGPDLAHPGGATAGLSRNARSRRARGRIAAPLAAGLGTAPVFL